MNKTYIVLTCKKKEKNFANVLESLIEGRMGFIHDKQFKVFTKSGENIFYIVSNKESSEEIEGFLGFMFIAKVIQKQEIKLAELNEENFWSNFNINVQGKLF